MKLKNEEKPVYQTPRAVSFGEMTSAFGDCTVGSANPTQCNSGTQAGGSFGQCNVGFSPGGACEVGNSAPAKCENGSWANNKCEAGNLAVGKCDRGSGVVR